MKLMIVVVGLCAWAYVAPAQNSTLKPVNINYKNRAYFYAASAPLKATHGLGGWARSENLYQPVTNNHPAGKQLVVVLRPDEEIPIAQKYAGFALYVINQTADTVFFEVQDSRLNMHLQAQDKKGKWRDIEYLPSSWCGNSYHQLFLPSQYQWAFTVPKYSGTWKTRIRAVLAYKLTLEGQEILLYSNEIEGSVNPGQFDKMPDYKPNGIMDPYNN